MIELSFLWGFILFYFILAMPHGYGILVPQTVMEALPTAVELWSLRHQTSRDVSHIF